VIKAKNGILPVWQEVGNSTYQLTTKISEALGVKAAHTGVLDPLAEGVIIVLLGEARLKKIELAGWKKTYEFDIAFGISTDSFDGMGIVTDCNFSPIAEKVLRSEIEKFSGKYSQTVPLFSGKKVNGKKLFMYHKEHLPSPILPKKLGQIYNIDLVAFKTVGLHKLLDEIVQKISKITHGEFRQQETIVGWKKFMQKTPDRKIQVATVRAEISRGLYVRSLSQDIARKIGSCGFVSRLVRTQNGEYTKEKCYSPEEVCASMGEL
jgi:tRNA pseudouridine(55) synthase